MVFHCCLWQGLRLQRGTKRGRGVAYVCARKEICFWFQHENKYVSCFFLCFNTQTSSLGGAGWGFLPLETFLWSYGRVSDRSLAHSEVSQFLVNPYSTAKQLLDDPAALGFESSFKIYRDGRQQIAHFFSLTT